MYYIEGFVFCKIQINLTIWQVLIIFFNSILVWLVREIFHNYTRYNI